jgi:predicted glycosyltransferase
MGPRVLFYSPDVRGLGHLQRTLALAAEVARRRPDATSRILTAAPWLSTAAVPPGCETVTMPALARETLPRDRTRDVRADRAAIIKTTMRSFAPDLVVVDHAPAGYDGELCAALEEANAASPRPTFVLALKDILDEPAAVRAVWRRDGAYFLLDRLYDRVLVFGSRDVFDATRAYGFSPLAAEKTRFCGYLVSTCPSRSAAQTRSELGIDAEATLVVVTVGSGEYGAPLLRAYAEAIAGGALDAVSLVVTGPLVPAATRAELDALASRIPLFNPVPWREDLPAVLAAADLVLTMGGSTLTQAIAAGTRTIAVPLVGPMAEQTFRAGLYEARGLTTVLPATKLTGARLAATMRRVLASPAPSRALDTGGLRRAGHLLARALP